MYRTEAQMKEARKNKKHSNQYWFKASRGGKEVTPRKDRPFVVQEEARNSRRQNKIKVNLPREESREENRENREKEGNSTGKEAKVKEVEAVLFIPSTPDSTLRKMLQKAEDQAARMMNSPSIRVVERSGTK